MKKRLRIKNKLVVCFGVILVIGFIACGFAANQICKRVLEESTLKSLARLATDTADKVNIILGEKQEEIEKLAITPGLTEENVSIEEKLSIIAERNVFLDFKDIALVDLDGNTYGINGLRRNIAGSIEFEEALKGKVTFSPAIKLENETVFVIAAPLVSSSGQVIGVIMGVENTESFTYILTEAGISDEFMILDSKAEMVAHSNEEILNNHKTMDEMKELAEFNDVYGVYQKMLSGENGVGYCINPETGEQNYISYAPINIGWSIALVNHSSKVLSVLKEFNYSLLSVTVIIIVAGLVAVYFMAREIANRINKITNYLDTVAHGDFEQPIPENLLELEDEMGDAARALEGMKSEIEEMIDTIKRCTDYMNDQMEDLTDGIKDELKTLLSSDEIDDKERKDIIKRLHILNQIVQGVNQLDSSDPHHSYSNSNLYHKKEKN